MWEIPSALTKRCGSALSAGGLPCRAAGTDRLYTPTLKHAPLLFAALLVQEVSEVEEAEVHQQHSTPHGADAESTPLAGEGGERL
ncbi:hypothetical protein SRHO_G00107270 [Serrasalmus rhombeus]